MVKNTLYVFSAHVLRNHLASIHWQKQPAVVLKTFYNNIVFVTFYFLQIWSNSYEINWWWQYDYTIYFYFEAGSKFIYRRQFSKVYNYILIQDISLTM